MSAWPVGLEFAQESCLEPWAASEAKADSAGAGGPPCGQSPVLAQPTLAMASTPLLGTTCSHQQIFESRCNSHPAGPGGGGSRISEVCLGNDGAIGQGLCTLALKPEHQQPPCLLSLQVVGGRGPLSLLW